MIDLKLDRLDLLVLKDEVRVLENLCRDAAASAEHASTPEMATEFLESIPRMQKLIEALQSQIAELEERLGAPT